MSRAARAVDVADELKRDVVVLGLEPARAGNAAACERELTSDGVRQFEAGEQARHCAVSSHEPGDTRIGAHD